MLKITTSKDGVVSSGNVSSTSESLTPWDLKDANFVVVNFNSSYYDYENYNLHKVVSEANRNVVCSSDVVVPVIDVSNVVKLGGMGDAISDSDLSYVIDFSVKPTLMDFSNDENQIGEADEDVPSNAPLKARMRSDVPCSGVNYFSSVQDFKEGDSVISRHSNFCNGFFPCCCYVMRRGNGLDLVNLRDWLQLQVHLRGDFMTTFITIVRGCVRVHADYIFHVGFEDPIVR